MISKLTNEGDLRVKANRFSKGGKRKVSRIMEPQQMTGVGSEADGRPCNNVTAEFRRRYTIVAGTGEPFSISRTTVGGPNVKAIDL